MPEIEPLAPKPSPPFPLRTIRSFVRRESRITTQQRQALASQQHFLLTPNSAEWHAWLHADCEQALEIGFGQGENLVHLAQCYPQRRYLGLEVYRPGIGALLHRLDQHQITNVRVCCADASEVMPQLADSRLDLILILFPDPWPKTRHHKRRLIQPVFIQALRQKLKIGGLLHVATDWQDYARSALRDLQQAAGLTNTTVNATGYSQRPEYRTLTRFEQRGQQLGHGVWDIIFKRTA